MRTFLDLIVFRAWSELLAETRRSYAGLLWWLIRPLMTLMVYGIVFSMIFKIQEKNFLLFLFSGIITWEWFSCTVMRCTNSILANKTLMSMVKVDPALFPLSICLVDMVKFFCGLIVLLCGIILSDVPVNSTIFVTLPLIILCEFILCTGCGLIASAFTPFFPDLFMIITTGMQLLLFLSGVFYQIQRLPDKLRFFLHLNPVAVLLEQYRNILLYNSKLSFSALLYVVLFGCIMGIFGFIATHSLQKIYTKRW